MQNIWRSNHFTCQAIPKLLPLIFKHKKRLKSGSCV
jgi:hypothetical protein